MQINKSRDGKRESSSVFAAFFFGAIQCNKEMDHKSAVVYMNIISPTYTKKTFLISNKLCC